MKISKRLLLIADLIEKNKKVFDIGCDHAYLSIYLTLYNNNIVTATDINDNALTYAKINIKKYELDDKINVVKTDGLKNLCINEEDIIIISGMGTNTIKHILKSNKLSDEIVISTHNEYSSLREYMINLGYYIEKEKFIIDKKIPYIIIKFKIGKRNYNIDDIIFGPFLKSNEEYLKYLINKNKNIYKKMSCNQKKEKEIELLINKIEKMLNKLEN